MSTRLAPPSAWERRDPRLFGDNPLQQGPNNAQTALERRRPMVDEAVETHVVFGFEGLPFPKEDLVVALVAVVSFLPAGIVVHFLVTRAARLFLGAKPKAA